MNKMQRRQAGWLALAFALALVGCGDSGTDAASDANPPARVAVPSISTQAVASGIAVPPTAGLAQASRLVGRWLRPDGGYVLEVRAVDPATGRMDVAYLNPRPIHVAQAEAKQVEGRLSVFVELQDVNYPGSTYRLTYLQPQDKLFGTYYQPAADQSFDVEFVRIP